MAGCLVGEQDRTAYVPLMSSMPAPNGAREVVPAGAPAAHDSHTFEHHWQDEADAAYLYRVLAATERNEQKRSVYARLAEDEDRHVGTRARVLTDGGHRPRAFRPSFRARALAWLGRRFGPGFLLPMLLAEEGREVKGYLDMHRTIPRGSPGGG